MAKWYEGEVAVPFGNRSYDVLLGGSHDLTFRAKPNTPVTCIRSGVITDISSPSWGKQLCCRMDVPVRNHPTFAYLHMSAINPTLRVGQRTDLEDLLGWTGGCTSPDQYAGTNNPTGQNFLNTAAMSSQPQIGIALCDGAGYGYRGWSDWTNGRPMDLSLDPMIILQEYLHPPTQQTDEQRKTFEALWVSVIPTANPTSGIAQECYKMLLAGNDPGPPLTKEQHFEDELFQIFPKGVMWWKNHLPLWKPY